MEPRAGGAGERLEAPPFRPPPLKPWLLLEVRLHIHARLGASENDKIRHRRRMTARRISSLIWISFGIAPRKSRSRKCEGARRPLQKSPAAIAWPVIARPVVARPIPVIPGAVVRPRPVVPIVVRAPETASPSVADHADLLDVGDLRHRRCRCDRHGGGRRRCREGTDQGTEQGCGDEANLRIHDVFLCLRNKGYRSCSDQIVAEPKCNADEQIFSQFRRRPDLSLRQTIPGSRG